MSSVNNVPGTALSTAQPRPGSLAPRLPSLDRARIGLLSTGKRNCDALLDAVGDVLVAQFGVGSTRRWTKPSVYRFSPLSRLSEIKDACDAVVVGLGDCGHGSSSTFHDVYWFEEQGIPVACVDTPGRMHKVRRDGDVFVMEYRTLKYVVADWKKAQRDAQAALLRNTLERQGIYRALRLAGAQPGARVRLLDTEFVLDELPPPPKRWLPASEGIPDYPYIVTDGVGRLDETQLRERAEELLPAVADSLVVAR